MRERKGKRDRERNRQRGRELERDTLSERAIRVAGCGSIVKVSEPRSKKSRHLTPLPLRLSAFPLFIPFSPSVPPSVSSAHSAHMWRESDHTDAQILLSYQRYFTLFMFYLFLSLHTLIGRLQHKCKKSKEPPSCIWCCWIYKCFPFSPKIHCYFLKSMK